jgi:hypothetical protein
LFGDDCNRDHLRQHAVEPDEAEEVCEDPLAHILEQSAEGNGW